MYATGGTKDPMPGGDRRVRGRGTDSCRPAPTGGTSRCTCWKTTTSFGKESAICRHPLVTGPEQQHPSEQSVPLTPGRSLLDPILVDRATDHLRTRADAVDLRWPIRTWRSG